MVRSLFGCFIVYFFVCLAGWLFGWLVVCLVVWFVGELADKLVASSLHSGIGLPRRERLHALVERIIICANTGTNTRTYSI